MTYVWQPYYLANLLHLFGQPRQTQSHLVHQDLHITKLRSDQVERADPNRWRSVEIHFRENPVPPFLRSLVDKLVGKDIRLSIAG